MAARSPTPSRRRPPNAVAPADDRRRSHPAGRAVPTGRCPPPTLAAAPPYADAVGRLCCLRGVSTLTALALTVELGDWTRFEPAGLGAFLGLVPSERSSGEQRRQGRITKTGNGHARRLLVEAAWHQRRPLRESATLAKRRQGQLAAVRTRADRSARRLHQRWHALERRGKRRTIVAVAVARELAGHCWALATM